MTQIDTSPAAIAAILDGVTPGPWLANQDEECLWAVMDHEGGFVTFAFPAECGLGGDTKANARFIAWARDGVPALAAERDRLAAQLDKAKADCAMFADANARQAMCISFTAANLGPEYCATIEGLPKAAKHVSAERDRLAAENARLRDAVALIRTELNTQINGGTGWMARFEEIVKGDAND